MTCYIDRSNEYNDNVTCINNHNWFGYFYSGSKFQVWAKLWYIGEFIKRMHVTDWMNMTVLLKHWPYRKIIVFLVESINNTCYKRWTFPQNKKMHIYLDFIATKYLYYNALGENIDNLTHSFRLSNSIPKSSKIIFNGSVIKDVEHLRAIESRNTNVVVFFFQTKHNIPSYYYIIMLMF